MKKQSQKDIVIKRLLETGKVSRNWCIREKFITRLGAIACDLNQEGWELKGEDDNGDYVYRIIKCPFKKTEYKVNGIIVSSAWKKNI